MLGHLPPLDRRFVLRPLERLFHKLRLAVRTLDRLILEQMFRALSGLDLLAQRLSRCVGVWTRRPDILRIWAEF